MMAGTPRVARALVRLLVGSEDREWVLADLDERFQAFMRERGASAARVWYWRQAIRSIPPLLLARLPDAPGSRAYATGATQDIRFAFRTLRRSPRFAALAAFTLAIGIAAATVLFGAAELVLFRPLPVSEPERLVLFSWSSTGAEMAGSVDDRPVIDTTTGERRSRSFSTGMYERFRSDPDPGLSHVFAFARLEQANVIADGVAEIATGQFVSEEYHTALGLVPAVGRLLVPEDGRPGAGPVLVMSDAWWRSRFGAAPDVVGRVIRVSGIPFTVVGVTGPEFRGTLGVGEAPDLTIPLVQEPALRAGDSNLGEPWNWWLFVMARLEAGADAETVAARLEPAFQRAAQEGWEALPPADRARPEFQGARSLPHLRVASGARGLAGHSAGHAPRIRVIALVVIGILLIACGNVAGLVLARSHARREEIAVQLALGASRVRVVRQLAVEGIMLAVVAASAGVLLAWIGRRSIMAWLPLGSDVASLSLVLDARVLIFAGLLAVLTGGIVGLLPGIAVTTESVVRGSGRTATRTGHTMRMGLTVLQVGLAFVLLTIAGLLTGTLRNLEREELGFDASGLLVFRIDPRLNDYRGEQIGELYEALAERLEALPGVAGVTLSRHALLGGSSERTGGGLFVHLPDGSVREGMGLVHRIRWNFPEVMGMHVVAGRGLARMDGRNAPRVVLVNEAFVHRFVPSGDALGLRVSLESPDDDGFEIVGVVRDAKYRSQREGVLPTIHVPYRQAGFTQMSFAIRASGEPSRLAPAVHAAIREVDPELPVFEMTTQRSLARAALSSERRLAGLASLFGSLALFLTCLALYGTLSFQVSRQAPEIGIRMALGARTGRVVAAVIRQTLVLVGAGLAIGLVATLPAGRLMTDQLFGVGGGAFDVRIIAALVIAGTSLLAAYVPARRAARVDPVRSLRSTR